MLDRSPTPPILASIAHLASGYHAWISDIWGVLHNGIARFPRASEACVTFRRSGGRIVLVTNAPKPAWFVERMLDRLEVPREAYDAIITSGDVTRDLIAPIAARGIYHLGPDYDRPIFEGLPVRFAAVEDAEVVVCSGLFDDDRETPADYAGMLDRLKARNLLMICVNPDLVVERGERIVYCAGALAEAYEKIGGRVAYAGKPHRAIYETAMRSLADLAGAQMPPDRILAIGDGIRTDMRGAATMGLDSLFIASQLHVPAGRTMDEALLGDLFKAEATKPVAAMSGLAW
ncbi:MAG TPA: TIGR01459 family HAD-type hydrolase [Hyphomicrobiaceae bacterium]|nr:TIGR01459 family HAD-type hydrolase [Hyphomicrobiaceae bacterium]